MVKVIVVVPEDDVWVHLNCMSGVQVVNTEIVVRAPASLFVMSRLVTVTPPSTTEPPLLSERWLKTTPNPVIVSVLPELMVSVLALPSESREIVPAMISVLKRFAASILRVLPAPSIVTVLVPAVNVLPAPEVSQLPCTIHEPEVSVIVPPEPVIDTSVNVAVEALAVRVPVEVTVRFEAPEIVLFEVVSVPETVSVLDTSISVLIVIVPLVVRL